MQLKPAHIGGFCLFLLCSAGLPESLRADTGRAGDAGGYLRMGLGARPLAMGGGSVSRWDDAATVYYNPAGLVFLKTRSFSGTVSALALDRKLFHAGYGQSLGGDTTLPVQGGFGAGWLCAGVDNIDARDFSGNDIGTLSAWEHAFFFSFALKPASFISVGINAKVLYYRLPEITSDGGAVTATGLGFDAGIGLRPFPFLQAGLVVRDLRSAYHWDTQNLWERGAQTNDEFPLVIQLGVSATPLDHWLITLDLQKIEGIPMTVSSGLEWSIMNLAFLRGGWFRDRITFGGGLLLSWGKYAARIDYAFVSDPVAPSPGHVFTWNVFF